MKSMPSIGIVIWILTSPLLSTAQTVTSDADNAALSPVTQRLEQPGSIILKGGAFSASPLIDSLGNVEVGTTHADSVTVSNTAATTLTISSVSSTNPQFSVAPTSATLLAHASRKFQISFRPTSTGAQMSSIIFKHSATTSPDTVQALGTGTAPTFTVNRAALVYGFVTIGSATTDSVAVRNGGDASLVITGITSSNASFTVSPISGTLLPGETKTFRITFAPPVAGLQTGNIVFVHNGLRTRDTVTVNGSGTAFSSNRRTVPFGIVPIGSSAVDSVTITNKGPAALTISSVASTNGSFAVNPSAASIPSGAQKTFTVTFTPADTLPTTGFLIFVHSSSSSPDSITMTGTGKATQPRFSVGRRTIPFDTVLVGKSRSDSVVVTNTGSRSLVISSILSTNGVFVVSPHSATLLPSGSAVLFIIFTPLNPGSQSGGIVFTHNAPGSPDTVSVSGFGAAPGFALNRKTVTFGKVSVGTQRVDSVVVTNTGTVPLVISSVMSTNAAFTVNPTNATIQPALSQAIRFTFAPTDTTPQSGSIVFTHNAPGSPDTVSVSGFGAAPGFALNRKTVAFGEVPVGTQRVDSVVVTNTGTVPLVISSVMSTNAAFTVNPTNATIQPALSQTIRITFAPADTTPQLGSIVFAHTASGPPDTVTVSGVGAAPGFTLNRKTVAFGEVPVGTQRVDSVVVTNTGTVPLVISSVMSTNAAFTVNPTNATIQPALSQTIRITFAPADTTPQSGSIVFAHTASGPPDTVTVNGVGAVAGFSLDKKTFAFGSVAVGSSRLDSVIATNTGTAPLVISNVMSTSTPFTVQPNNAVIPPAHSQAFDITFAPTDTVPHSAGIIFTHDAPGLHDTVAVSGAGTHTAFSVNRTSVAFGYVTIGGQKADSVVVTNMGSTSLRISDVKSDNAMFTVLPDSVTLPPGVSQTYRLLFTPSATTPQVGHVVFTHNAASSPDTVTLSGTGTVAVFSLDRRSVSFGEVPVGKAAQDSVVVTNNGASTLLITNVASTNGTFAVTPATASVPVGDHATFLIAFTPTNTTALSAYIVFTHIAVSSPDTVRVSGTGTQAAISFNKRSIAFGFVVLGGSKVDSTIVTNTGTTPLIISSVLSTNPVFTVNPVSAAVTPGTTKTFILQCAPKDTNPQTGTIVFNHNGLSGHDTITASATGLAPLSPPDLLAPSNGSVDLALPLALSWSNVSAATGYSVQVATDSMFSVIVLDDQSVVGPGRQVNGLPYNTRFYWRVSTRNVAGSGPWSPSRTMRTLSSAHLSGTLSFSGDLSSDSYQMFGLPGIGNRSVGSILPGAQNIDWRILRDTGRDTTYPAFYQDLTADSVLRTGEGYWLLAKRNLDISRTDTLAPLADDGTFPIAVHQGWNIISNPFTVSVLRSAVLAQNGLPGESLFWEHDGTTTSSSGTTLDPFKGYYFFNDSARVTSLNIPYPFTTTVAKVADAQSYAWRVELVFNVGKSVDKDNYIGVASQATPGRNALDQREPPIFFNNPFLYFPHPEWDAKNPRFASDFRSEVEPGQTWHFEVWNPRGGTGTITFLGVETIPQGYGAVLINALNTSPVDLRRDAVYSFPALSNRMQFTLLIGTEAYIRSETSKLVPGTFALEQNYPNPFNPKTVISGQWTVNSDVRLEVFDILGRKVATLANGSYPSGKYTFVFDGTNLASGVYFYRLTAGSYSGMRKMLLIR